MATPKKKSPKTTVIRFRGWPLDVKRLNALAKFNELTPSAVLRRLIAEEHARCFTPSPNPNATPHPLDGR